VVLEDDDPGLLPEEALGLSSSLPQAATKGTVTSNHKANVGRTARIIAHARYHAPTPAVSSSSTNPELTADS